ncbi:MAG: inverse autotransporter beta domain-containing protein, partial [Proteobacteria bacterium]|nr:inverse autotransporter beta domain-containing protein [Pseudomonadota bacterium]
MTQGRRPRAVFVCGAGEIARAARSRARIGRFREALLVGVAVVALSLRPAAAGPTFYDLNSLLFEPSPTDVRRPAPLPAPLRVPYPQPAPITQPAVVPRPIVAPLPAPPAPPAAPPVRRPVAAAPPVPRPVRPAAIAGRKWQPHVDIVGKLGTDRFIGEVDLFMPVRQDDKSMWFVNLRGQIDDDEEYEANLGLGYRTLTGDGWIWGANIFGDVRETQHDNTFYQVSAGLEAMSEVWDVRFNGYLVGTDAKDISSFHGLKLIGKPKLHPVLADIKLQERALAGIDGEVGYRIPVGEDTRLFVGAFYFDADNVDALAGLKARLETRVHDLGFLG